MSWRLGTLTRHRTEAWELLATACDDLSPSGQEPSGDDAESGAGTAREHRQRPRKSVFRGRCQHHTLQNAGAYVRKCPVLGCKKRLD